MRAVLCLACLLVAHAVAAREPSAQSVDAVVTTSTQLPPFSALELGISGCMPLSMRVAEGDFGFEVTAQARA